MNFHKEIRFSKNPKLIRNICILAHVDHGKTTLVDHLIASNEIISSSMAGHLRYMDTREDEQERRITMKASSIMLNYSLNEKDYKINVIDSPGHVDFSSEVSCAIRLCDGAVILVDAVEGVCAQTQVVLNQTLSEGIRPCLLINKMDRLITDLMLNPIDAYYHIFRIVEEVNSLMACFQRETKHKDYLFAQTSFSPSFGNVLFCSGLEGWGFDIGIFAKLLHNKLNVPFEDMLKGLWGDYYYDVKTKAILPNALSLQRKPMFVQFILDNIWSVHDAFLGPNASTEKQEKMASVLSPANSVYNRCKSFKDKYLCLMKSWLPLVHSLICMVIETLPSPLYLNDLRITNLMSSPICPFQSLPNPSRLLKQDFYKCNSSSASPVIIYVSKMIYYDKKELMGFHKFYKSQNDQSSNNYHKGHIFSLTQKDNYIAYSRIFSGTVRVGMKLYVLTPKHNPIYVSNTPNCLNAKFQHTYHEIIVENLYIIMGRDLIPTEQVSSGNIFGVGGLGKYIFKSGTISSTLYCPSFCPMNFQVHPIISVAIEAEKICDYDKVIEAMGVLNLADPILQFEHASSGEYVIRLTGEVHLQKCIEDLKHLLGDIPINISEPILPFRETLSNDKPAQYKLSLPQFILDTMSPSDFSLVVNDTKVEFKSSDGKFYIKLHVEPLGSQITNFLESMANLIENISEKHASSKEITNFNLKLQDHLLLNNHLKEENINQIWCFGSKQLSTNILIDKLNIGEEYQRPLNRGSEYECSGNLDLTICNAFDLACQRGPIMSEPVTGVCFIIDEIKVNDELLSPSKVFCNLTECGQLVSTLKQAFQSALIYSKRLRCALPIYQCQVKINAKYIAACFSVLTKKAAKIISESQLEGSSMFTIESLIPLPEIFGFSDEMRSKTSGTGQVLLTFDSWGMIDVDPYMPKEMIENLNSTDKLLSSRLREYINIVRKRKGLPTDEKLIKDAEKQRTIKKNK